MANAEGHKGFSRRRFLGLGAMALVGAACKPPEPNTPSIIPPLSSTPDATVTLPKPNATAIFVPSATPGVTGTPLPDAIPTLAPSPTAEAAKPTALPTLAPSPTAEAKATVVSVERVTDADAERIKAEMPDFYYVDAASKSLKKYDKTGFTFEIVDKVGLSIKNKDGKVVGWAEHFYMTSIEKSYFYMVTDSSTTTKIPIDLVTKANKFASKPNEPLNYPLQLVHGFVDKGLNEVRGKNDQGSVDFSKKYEAEALTIKNGEDAFQKVFIKWLAFKNNVSEEEVLKNLDKEYNIGGVKWTPSKGVVLCWTDTAGVLNPVEKKLSLDEATGKLKIVMSNLPNSSGNEDISLTAGIIGSMLADGVPRELTSPMSVSLFLRKSTTKSLATYFTFVKK